MEEGACKMIGQQLLLQQFRALLCKNLLLSWRRRVPTALHLTSSFFFILLIWGVDRSTKSRIRTTTSFKNLPDPPSFSVTAIPPCESGFFIKRPCYDFVWSTNSSSTITSIIQRIMSNNPGRPIPASKVLGFSGVAETEDWLLRNPLQCTGALHMEERSSSIIAYGIQTNSTSKMERGYYEDPVFKFQLPLQLAAEREIAVFLAGGWLCLYAFRVHQQVFFIKNCWFLCIYNWIFDTAGHILWVSLCCFICKVLSNHLVIFPT